MMDKAKQGSNLFSTPKISYLNLRLSISSEVNWPTQRFSYLSLAGAPHEATDILQLTAHDAHRMRPIPISSTVRRLFVTHMQPAPCLQIAL